VRDRERTRRERARASLRHSARDLYLRRSSALDIKKEREGEGGGEKRIVESPGFIA
jgi:hypothetical protein